MVKSMLALLYILIFVVVSFTGNGVLTQSYKDDPCTTSNGIRGICKLISQCQSAHDDIRNGNLPKICGFEGIKPIVCCTDSGSQSIPRTPVATTTTNNTTTRTRIPTSTIRKVGALSDEKCRMFYPNIESPTLIAGGKEPADVDEFRHMALIGFGEEGDIQWQCGGSLVSPQFVMTAAHCLYSPQSGVPKWVLLGDLDISTDSDGTVPQQIRIKKLISHPKYKRPSKNHDIALLELETPANWTKHVGPACLDTRRNHSETHMIATGWGQTSFTGELSKHLLKVDLRVVSVDQCRDFFKNIDQSQLPNGIDDDLHVCAGEGPLNDSCQGDSGGPLQIISDIFTHAKVYMIVGVTSFGKPCGLTDGPGVYTRVYSHLSWLEQNIWPSG